MGKTSDQLGARDDNIIDRDQKSDHRRWSEKLGVSVEELVAAIDAVGSNSEDVERYLRERAQPSRSA